MVFFCGRGLIFCFDLKQMQTAAFQQCSFALCFQFNSGKDDEMLLLLTSFFLGVITLEALVYVNACHVMNL